MINPVLVEVVRGALVESCHRGSIAVADASGHVVWGVGDVDRPVYPRSAIKAFQALPLVESGAADRYRLTDEELALACSSHGGEADHVAGVERMLARTGFDVTVLECGSHWPSHHSSAFALARSGGAPSAIHNNCSGKHAGFVCTSCALSIEPGGYTSPSHPMQRMVKAVLEDLTGTTLDQPAVDGCSVPTWAVPLNALARAFARFGTGMGLEPARARAAARLRAACAAKPWFVAGTGRFCTKIMKHFGARVFAKTGAEGVFSAALPELGFGIAVKCDDGATRAAEVMVAATIARFLPMDEADRSFIEGLIKPVLRNWNDRPVGMLRPTEPLLAAS